MKEKLPKRLLIYLLERFHPIKYAVLIAAMFWASLSVAQVPFNLTLLMIAGIMFAFFFRIRIFDDLKDHSIDNKLNPQRPLPRGLLTRKELHGTAIVTAGIELILVGLFDWRLLLYYGFVIAFTIITYHEFFAGKHLRKNILWYAMPHVLIMAVIGGFSLLAIEVFLNQQIRVLEIILLCCMNYTLGLLFEISRKMRSPKEEKRSHPSFTKLLGNQGAWYLLTSLYTLSALVAIILINYNYFFILLYVLPSIILIHLLLFKKEILVNLRSKHIELLGGVMILYVFLLIGLWGVSI